MKRNLVILFTVIAFLYVFFIKHTKPVPKQLADAAAISSAENKTARGPASVQPKEKMYDEIAQAYEKIEQKNVEINNDINAESPEEQQRLANAKEYKEMLERTVPIETTREIMGESEAVRLEKAISIIQQFLVDKNKEDISILYADDIKSLNQSLVAQNFFIVRNQYQQIEIRTGREMNDLTAYDADLLYQESLRIKEKNSLADLKAKTELSTIFSSNDSSQ